MLSKFGQKSPFSIMFLSRRLFTCAWISFEVVKISFDFLASVDPATRSWSNSFEKLVMHLRGVISSCVTEDCRIYICKCWYSM